MPRMRSTNAAEKIVKQIVFGPTPERLRMAGENIEAFNSDIDKHAHYNTIRMTDETVLDSMVRRQEITGDQYHSGMAFYRDWYESGMAASGVIDPTKERVDCENSEFMTAHKLDAMARWNLAIRLVGRIPLRPVTEIVLFNMRFVEYGRRYCRQNNAKLATVAAKSALRLSLDALDYHYHGRRKLTVQVYHVDGYRPTGLVDD